MPLMSWAEGGPRDDQDASNVEVTGERDQSYDTKVAAKEPKCNGFKKDWGEELNQWEQKVFSE